MQRAAASRLNRAVIHHSTETDAHMEQARRIITFEPTAHLVSTGGVDFRPASAPPHSWTICELPVISLREAISAGI
jgi:hypothetical protein